MKSFIVFVVACVAFTSAFNLKRAVDDADLTVEEIITKFGYPVETHSVTTSDGYILKMQRIPYGKNGPNDSKKVLMLQHGILSSSIDWVLTGPNKGLALIMADLGYDVWLGNGRGNTQSRNHTTLNPDKDDKFWEFSWHEIGVIDLPAMIDYMLEKTGVESIYYAGHSQGTTSFYVMTSMLPEYNAKIKVHVSLAPIAFMNHMTSPLMHIMAFWEGPLGGLLNFIGVNEFLPNNDFMKLLADPLCGETSITKILCSNALFAICGFSAREMNETFLPELMAHTPAGSSTRQVLHYAQEVNTGTFQQYDFGLIGNLEKYNAMYPPHYDLSKVTADVYMLYSHNDWLSAESDVTKLCNRLGNCKGKFLVSDTGFNHLDYMYGIHAPSVAYDKMISLMARY